MSVQDVLKERGERYGSFAEHSKVSQTIKNAITGSLKGRLDDDQREALSMIAHKIARIVNGDPDYADNWIDIAGYATLVADRLQAPDMGNPIAQSNQQVAQPDADGWIDWKGGECPFSGRVRIDYIAIGGVEVTGLFSDLIDWNCGIIQKYRIHKPAEPEKAAEPIPSNTGELDRQALSIASEEELDVAMTAYVEHCGRLPDARGAVADAVNAVLALRHTAD